MDEDEQAPAQVGHAQPCAQSDQDYPVAVLWIPDPTQRRGWCEWWVKRQEPQKPPAGFRRGGNHGN